MEPTKELIDAIYRDKVLRARRESPWQKLMDGPQLFDRARQLMKDGVRHQHPEADEATVERLVSEKIARLRRVEEFGFYRPAGELDRVR